MEFEELQPDSRHEWINQSSNDFDQLIPIANKETKAAKVVGQEQAIFKNFSFGVVTNRDEWVYSNNSVQLKAKVQSLIATYNADRKRLEAIHNPKERGERLDKSIKWTRAVKRDLANNVPYKFDPKMIATALYRPFFKRFIYFSPQLNEMQNRMAEFFGTFADQKNVSIVFSDPTSQKPFMTLATDICPDMHLVGAASGSVTVPRWVGGTQDNITEWAVRQFNKHYERIEKSSGPLTKNEIFWYVYGVLHNPIYREKYVGNLRREFPRIPLYAEFGKWAKWGEKLIALHVSYETVEPWPLKRVRYARPEIAQGWPCPQGGPQG